ncbi:MAG TPA: hemerythrin domain-containing protein [Actinomycetota bacterium]
MSTMQPLRDEHEELLPHIEAIRTVADGVGSVSLQELRPQIADVSEFLRDHLIPHAKAEEAVLYPEVERAMAAPRATAPMARDHVEVAALTAELGEIEARIDGEDGSNTMLIDARRVLYGLYALVKLHFTEEEEIYVPILEDALDDQHARAMFDRMEAAAAAARGST